MLGTHHFFSFSVHVQHLGRASRPEPRVLHFDPTTAPTGTALRLLQKGAVVQGVRLQDIQAIAYDAAEPRTVILVLRGNTSNSRVLIDFLTDEENALFRLAAASVMVGEFDATRFTSMVVLEGPLAKRTLSGHKSRYGILVARRLILLNKRTAAYPRDVITLTSTVPRLDLEARTLHLDVGGGQEVLLRCGQTQAQVMSWVAAVTYASTAQPLAPVLPLEGAAVQPQRLLSYQSSLNSALNDNQQVAMPGLIGTAMPPPKPHPAATGQQQPGARKQAPARPRQAVAGPACATQGHAPGRQAGPGQGQVQALSSTSLGQQGSTGGSEGGSQRVGEGEGGSQGVDERVRALAELAGAQAVLQGIQQQLSLIREQAACGGSAHAAQPHGLADYVTQALSSQGLMNGDGLHMGDAEAQGMPHDCHHQHEDHPGEYLQGGIRRPRSTGGVGATVMHLQQQALPGGAGPNQSIHELEVPADDETMGQEHQQLELEAPARTRVSSSRDTDIGSDGSLAQWRGGGRGGGRSTSWVDHPQQGGPDWGDMTGHNPQASGSTSLHPQQQQQRWQQRLSDISTQHSRQEQDNVVEIKPDISHILPGLTLTLRVKKPGHGSRTAPSSSNRSSQAAVIDGLQPQLQNESRQAEGVPAEVRVGSGRQRGVPGHEAAGHEPMSAGGLLPLSAHPPSAPARQYPPPASRRSTLASSAQGSGASSSTRSRHMQRAPTVTDNPLYVDHPHGPAGTKGTLPASMEEVGCPQAAQHPITATHTAGTYNASHVSGTSSSGLVAEHNHSQVTAWVEEQISHSKRAAVHEWMTPRPPLTAVAAYVTTHQEPHPQGLQHTGAWGLPHKQGCAPAGGSHDDSASDLDSAIGGQGGKPTMLTNPAGHSKTSAAKTLFRGSRPSGGSALAPVGVDQPPLASIREHSPLRQAHEAIMHTAAAAHQQGLAGSDQKEADTRGSGDVKSGSASEKGPWPATVVHTSISLQQLLRRLNQGEITPQGFLHTLASS